MRTLKIIASFGADYYGDVSNEMICEALSKEMAGELAVIFKGIQSYIGTTVEVVNSVSVDEIKED